jgi:prepilin-type N-terminal cleavage/methylation domain-containing protein
LRSRITGFTLGEVLVVIAIIVILAALVSLLGPRAIASAKQAHSHGNLKQHHLALKLYQSEWGGDGVYGLPEEMGYPLDTPEMFAHVWPNVLKVPEQAWQTKCCCHPDLGKAVIQYQFKMPTSRSEALEFEDNLVTFVDLHCNDYSAKIRNTLEPRRGLGVLLSGTLVNRYKEGNMDKFSWWAEPHK